MSELAPHYGPDVYTMMASRAVTSADVVAPLVLEHLSPRSVIDYGGGTGEWADAFRRHGAQEVLVVDGPWVDRSQLVVAPDEFTSHDLEERFEPPHEYDLGICLNVAGHIPPDREADFVDSVAALAPVVIFCAPVPDQPGIGPVAPNNRLPVHWADQFAARGFDWVDSLRLAVWEDPRVTWWYSQNIALLVRREVLAEIPALAEHRTTRPPVLIHPGMLPYVAKRALGLRAIADALPGALARAVTSRVKRARAR